MTVHQAKGREFPVVLVYVPKPHKAHSPCPSTEWWDEDDASEEREVAYVAFTRSKDVLILAVHMESYAALQETQPDFVSLFQIVAISKSDRRLVAEVAL